MTRSLQQLMLAALVFSSITNCREQSPTAALATNGVSAEQALSTFELEPGFQIELLASEPLVADPVDMEIDEYGRLYVVEMHGYPMDLSGSGIIKLLSDADGDGKMDKCTVFADSMKLPNSVMRWKKGILVTDAPNLLYFEDNNNDGIADIRDTLLTGFALSNPQHNLNTPLLGIDNWIYLAHEGAVATQTYQKEFGDEGSDIFYPAYPKGPRLAPNASGRSVRFRPDQQLLETTSSASQFGHSFDTWGHHFLVGNSNHIYQEVMQADYLKRNPYLAESEATESISDHKDASEIFPITKNPEYQLLTDVGVITSACGLTLYQGGIFPGPFENASFVAEPVSNLIHVDKLADKGASFVASRIRANKEFLASTDPWFRPVNMYVGPDGALYVVDYYRQIIEHPEWMGEEVVKSGKLYNGHDKGRIYRITPSGSKPANWTKGLKLGDASSEELAKQLANPNSWWRNHAQRLLVDRKDAAIIPMLKKMAAEDRFGAARLHALWTLQGMEALQAESIKTALTDRVAGIRENAIKLAELHITHDQSFIAPLLSMQDDADPKVRFQLLCTLGSVKGAEALQARQKLLFRDMEDKWVQTAALSADYSQTRSLFKVVIDSFRQDQQAYTSLVKRISSMMGAGETADQIHQFILQSTASKSRRGWEAPALEGLASGIRSRDKSISFNASQESALTNIVFDDADDAIRSAALAVLRATGLHSPALVKSTTAKAASIARVGSQSEPRRVNAIRLIALGDPASQADLLKQLIKPQEQAAVQMAALKAFSSIPNTGSTEFLLAQWSNLTPQVQQEALNSFLTSDDRIAMLLKAIESGKVQASSVGWHRSVQLMAQDNLELRKKARELLTKNEKDREKVNTQYKQALSLKGNPEKGEEVYKLNCSSCHMVMGSMGVSFGPDLGTVHNWSAEAIMANILAPDLSIASGYDLWSATMNNGESFEGIIQTETAAAITLMNAGRESRTINRNNIRILKAMNMSSMPSGLEKQINQQQMADLLAFLRENKSSSK